MLDLFSNKTSNVEEGIKNCSYPLSSATDLEPLMDRIGDARIVLLGEATHGTHEYYTWRAEITKRLIEEKDFDFIGVEGDWPDCYRINRFIKGYENAGDDIIDDVLMEFKRWPTWMWANWEIAGFAEWLREWNIGLTPNDKVGFYGLDVYSLWESFEEILKYLERVDPKAFKKAQEALMCFEPYASDDGQAYARSMRLVPDSCEDEVVEMLSEIRERMTRYNGDPEAAFNTEQNALVAVNAEKYYRSMVQGTDDSWNVRDRHMMETLSRLADFHGNDSKAVIWEHNTHIGDARATDMARHGMINIGQLAREEYGDDVVLVGFGSYEGSVVAGQSWGAEMEVMNMPEARKNSWEHALHQLDNSNRLIIFDDRASELLDRSIGHRAIGVVYQPEHESRGNYVPTVLPERYDMFIYLDKTKALHPLHLQAEGSQMPETYPFGV